MKIQIYKQLSIIIGLLAITNTFIVGPYVFANSKLQEAQSELKEQEASISNLSQSKAEADAKVRTLNKELEFLESEISSSQKGLEKTTSTITSIQSELKETREYIEQLEKTIASQKILIKEYVSTLYTKRSVSLFEVLLSNTRLSELLGSVEKTGAMQDSISDSITVIQAREQEVVEEKQHLFDKEEELLSLKILQEDQQTLLEQSRAEKEQLLEVTKGDQEKYTQLLQESRQNKQNILNTISVLTGGKKPGALSLEEAYNLAVIDAARLGNKIRPEFLVGVMKVESGLGGNVGGFYYKDSLSNCAAREGNTTRLNYAREEQAFEQIVSKLNLPLTQPVSGCPYPHYIGTGGAMGPAQIMPATWLGYEPRLRQLKGGDVNPWSVEDAMLAMGMILLGKVGDQNMIGNIELERRAAMCYVGGCKHQWYADKVLAEAERVKELLGK